MLKLCNLNVEFDTSRCQQCGACLAVCPHRALAASLQPDGLSKVVVDDSLCVRCGICVKVCPATMQCEVSDYRERLAERSFCFLFNADDEVRRRASSGGAARTLIVDSLGTGFVDGVYALGKDDRYPFCKGRFFFPEQELEYDDLPNSVYHSVMLNRELRAVEKCKTLMLVGTTCQLKSAEKIVRNRCDQLIKVAIFCKQQKTLGSTHFIYKLMGGGRLNVESFEFNYRGNGWPGVVRINQSEISWETAACLPFGHRLWSVPGCNICVDPFCMDADISLMDPWKIDPANDLGRTLAVVHTPVGAEMIKAITSLTCEPAEFASVEPALGLDDIEQKQKLAPFYRGESVSLGVRLAGMLDRLHRSFMEIFLGKLPRLPLVAYRIFNRIPNLRGLFLR